MGSMCPSRARWVKLVANFCSASGAPPAFPGEAARPAPLAPGAGADSSVYTPGASASSSVLRSSSFEMSSSSG